MSIIEDFKFNNLKNTTDLNLTDIDIDKVHFSGQYPTLFFKEVKQFDEQTLKKIATIQHKLWNYKKVMFLYVTSLTEIRIYNCMHKPIAFDDNSDNIETIVENYEIAQSYIDDKEKLQQLIEIFSSYAIDSGLIWTRDNNYLEKIKLDKRIDNFLVTSLTNLANKFKEEGLTHDTIHALIMRSLFIMYLEDKQATPKEFYKDADKNANSYFDLLDNKEATYNFFEKIEKNFNGNVFPVSSDEFDQVNVSHLKLLKQCFTNGDLESETLFKDWRIFKFDIIDIELLSQIYENFLSKIDKEKSGSYYTPPELVELILNEVLPINSKNYKVKILDPTCGSGIFLVEAYKRIVKRWEKAHPDKTVDFKILKTLMTNNIYGVELNPNSIKVATFSLYLAMLDFLHPKTLWYQGDEKFPHLIQDKEDKSLIKQGNNLFRVDTILSNKEIENDYDIIVGNPPYSRKNIPEHVKKYCKDLGFSQEFVIPFIHKASLLAPNGKIVLLAPTKLLTNTLQPAQNFRKWLFQDNYVEKIYNLSILRKAPKTFGGQLFSSAVVPASIYFFQPKAPEKISKTVEYWAPKTYIKSHIAEGVLIDSSDIKYLPRKECQKPNTKIWKIAQWGTLNDFNILNKFLTQEKNFLNYLDENGIDKKNRGVGFQLMGNSKSDIENSTFISELDFMDAKNINRYYTNKSLTGTINDSIKSKVAKKIYPKYYKTDILNIPKIDAFRRLGNVITFKAPHVLIKEGFSKNRFCSSYLDYDCTFTSTILGLSSNDINILKLIVSYLNSKFSVYFLFLTSSSWGIEREKVKPNELYLLPYINDSINMNKIIEIYNKIELSIKNPILISDISEYESEIDKIIAESFDISVQEQIFIDDTIKYTVDLFHKGDKSIAIKPIDSNTLEMVRYGKKLCEELNETLKDGTLKVVSTIYKISYYSPLCLVVIQFIEDIDNQNITTIVDDGDFNQILSKLNKFTLSQYSKGIYVQKNLTYFDDDKIYIIKPNQKRFWTLSSAIEDAQNITLEMMSMPE